MKFEIVLAKQTINEGLRVATTKRTLKELDCSLQKATQEFYHQMCTAYDNHNECLKESFENYRFIYPQDKSIIQLVRKYTDIQDVVLLEFTINCYWGAFNEE